MRLLVVLALLLLFAVCISETTRPNEEENETKMNDIDKIEGA